MPEHYEKTIDETVIPEPPRDLARAIVAEVRRREIRALRVRIAASSALFAGSVYFIIVGGADFSAELARSGFFSFASLPFSDFSLMIANFWDFTFTIAESFPAFSAAALLGAVAAGVWSAGSLVDEAALLLKA